MKYIILDFEATCEDSSIIPSLQFRNEIIEFSAVKLNENLEEVDSFEHFVKPIVNPILTEFCTSLTSISNEMISSAKSFKEVVSLFKEWLGEEDYIILAWGRYDKRQFLSDLKLHGLENQYGYLFNRYVSLKHLHHDLIAKSYERPYSMSKALKKAQLTLEGTHHRGIDDSRNIAKIFRHYKDLFLSQLKN